MPSDGALIRRGGATRTHRKQPVRSNCFIGRLGWPIAWFLSMAAAGMGQEARPDPRITAAGPDRASPPGGTLSPAASESSSARRPVQVELVPLGLASIRSQSGPVRAHTNSIHWTWECTETGARFGHALTGDADFDGDGYRDL